MAFKMAFEGLQSESNNLKTVNVPTYFVHSKCHSVIVSFLMILFNLRQHHNVSK